MKGYALVDSQNVAFSWHRTAEDAAMNAEWQNNIMGRSLRMVKDVEATWPEWSEEVSRG